MKVLKKRLLKKLARLYKYDSDGKKYIEYILNKTSLNNFKKLIDADDKAFELALMYVDMGPTKVKRKFLELQLFVVSSDGFGNALVFSLVNGNFYDIFHEEPLINSLNKSCSYKEFQIALIKSFN